MREGNKFPLVFVCFQVVLAYEVKCYVSVQVTYLLDKTITLILFHKNYLFTLFYQIKVSHKN